LTLNIKITAINCLAIVKMYLFIYSLIKKKRKMPNKVSFFIVINGNAPSTQFLRRIKNLFGLEERASLYIEKPTNLGFGDLEFDLLAPEPKKLFLFEDYEIEEELMEEIFKWLTIMPLTESFKFSEHMADQSYNKASFYHTLKDLFELQTAPRTEVYNNTITLPLDFKDYLRRNGKRALLSRCFIIDQSILSGKFDFNSNLDFKSSTELIHSLSQENYYKFVEFSETIRQVYDILNTVVCRLRTSGFYIGKLKPQKDPVEQSIANKVMDSKVLDRLLPYATWKEHELTGNLRSINIYQYIGPSEKEFLDVWAKMNSENQVDFVAQGERAKKRRKLANPNIIAQSLPANLEGAKEMYKKLTTYPISPADFDTRTNKIWKKKTWVRFPIETLFRNTVNCYDDIQFIVESPYEDNARNAEEEDRILSSFSGFRWDHLTLEEEYLKEMANPLIKDNLKGHLAVEGWLLDHFCCGNVENYGFFKKWITFVNCYPNRKVSVATALRGGNGLTKTFFSHLMSLMFGSHAFNAVDANLLFGNFTTARLSTSCFVSLEEAKLTGEHYSKFKDSVTGTGPTSSNRKYGDISEIIVMASYLICTNNHHYYQCDMDDRRIFGLDFDNKFFKDLSKDIYSEEGRWKEAVDVFTKKIMADNYRAWRLYLGYLFNTVRPEIEDFPTLSSVRPNTIALDKQKLLSLGDEVHWWISCIKNKQHMDSEFLDNKEITPEGMSMKPKLVNYKQVYDPEFWDGLWLKKVHYRDFYLYYRSYMEKKSNKRSKNNIMNETKFLDSFARNLPDRLQGEFSSLSSENPWINFGAWRDHYNELTGLGWPISTSL
jgi:hypothetical protein